mmetsp:Transcript_12182/g.24950  ORF Transcript_12182/g.24950 Transcript_12182/m.24950 type:complete len:96 (+) Transcript_12182:474-761(+)
MSFRDRCTFFPLSGEDARHVIFDDDGRGGDELEVGPEIVGGFIVFVVVADAHFGGKEDSVYARFWVGNRFEYLVEVGVGRGSGGGRSEQSHGDFG